MKHHEATLVVDQRFTIGDVPRRLFGGFVEQAGRAVYGGLYDPGHPTADEHGFRHDVIAALHDLGTTTVRYPGGNFVSGHRWEDGTGPRADRPARLDFAWQATEPNHFGLDEFVPWARTAGIEPMLAVNLGTRGVIEALDMLEYCNGTGETFQAKRRRANGFAEPFDVRMWCLGNEPDGPWQLGHTDAQQYGRLARQTAQAMRMFDRSLELVVAGSSGREMPTYGSWERTVLDETYDDVDYISAHQYYWEKDGDLQGYLGAAVDFDSYLHDVIAVVDHVRSVKRSQRTVGVSVDEWGVWYQDDHRDEVPQGSWPHGFPRLEENYSIADAVVYGSMLIAMLKRVDRVRAASAAQLVNVIGPVMTVDGGGIWTQAIFHPFAAASRTIGHLVLDSRLSTPSIDTDRFGAVPAVDAVTTVDPSTDDIRIFAINRAVDATVTLDIDLSTTGEFAGVDWSILSDDDPRRASHGIDTDPRPRDVQAPLPSDGRLSLRLPPVSWNTITLRRRSAA